MRADPAGVMSRVLVCSVDLRGEKKKKRSTSLRDTSANSRRERSCDSARQSTRAPAVHRPSFPAALIRCGLPRGGSCLQHVHTHCERTGG
eukprot:2134462-Prymnesium_polylepis.1